MLHLALPDDLIIFGSDTITFAVQIIKYTAVHEYNNGSLRIASLPFTNGYRVGVDVLGDPFIVYCKGVMSVHGAE